MKRIDSFTISPWTDWIYGVITQSKIQGELLEDFLTLVYKHYGKVVVICQPLENGYAYTFAQKQKIVTLDSLLQILSRQEFGWTVSNGILHSPRPSKLSLDSLEAAIVAARSKTLVSQKEGTGNRE
ncbi:MAG: hypothetical protein WA999_13480 [Spirulinaceae cyanobacterium]